MKALFVSHCNNLSGANKSFLSLILQLKDKIDICVLVNNKNGPLTDCLGKYGIKTIYYPYAWWFTTPRKNIIKRKCRHCSDYIKYRIALMLGALYLDILKTENFDVIYTNTSTVDVGFRISQKLNIPHVWHVREFGQEDFCFTPVVSAEQQWSSFNKSNKIILISAALAKKFSAFVDKDKITLIYNGFDTIELSSDNNKKGTSRTINILVTGQVCEGKGQVQAVEAVASLYNQGYLVHLFIAGAVDHSYLDFVLSKYPNCDQWLTVLGIVEDMYKLREKIDIELICSKSEAFGRVTIEAMLHCIPVIGANTGGTPELIIDHETGLLYEHGNFIQLSECIKELIESPELYNNIILNAKNYASTFTIEKTANAVLDTLTKVCERQ